MCMARDIDNDKTAHTHAYGESVTDHEALKLATEQARSAWAIADTEHSNKAKRKLRDQCRDFTGLAMAKLVDLITRGDTGAVQLAAVKELLDRGYGKAKEVIEVDTKAADLARVVQELNALRDNPVTRQALLTLAEATAKNKRD